MRPLIGIPLCLDDRERWKPGRQYQYIDTAYARAVAAGGGVAVYLPLHEDPEALAERLDGLLLPGGDDLPPAQPYPPDVRFELAPPAQLDFDLALLESALRRELPLLAICYGAQLLALQRGGSLHHHIPVDVPAAREHQLPERDGRHALRVEPGTRLAALLGSEPGPVNSLHHQAVREPGRGLRVCARAEDGVVEAIEAEAGPFCLGVQWHPEKLGGDHRARVFGAFVAACTKRRAGG